MREPDADSPARGLRVPSLTSPTQATPSCFGSQHHPGAGEASTTLEQGSVFARSPLWARDARSPVGLLFLLQKPPLPATTKTRPPPGWGTGRSHMRHQVLPTADLWLQPHERKVE